MKSMERIFLHEIFEEYIPDFTYCLVNNHDYSNKVLLEHRDEMSLIMLLNKIQTVADLSEFFTIPPEELNRIVEESPTAVIDIIVMVMTALCTKLNLTSGETEACVQKVRTRDMGYLWANMEKIDVQAEREKSRRIKEEMQAEIDSMQAEIDSAQAELATVQANAAKAVAEAQDAEAKAQSENVRLRALLAKHGIEQE